MNALYSSENGKACVHTLSCNTNTANVTHFIIFLRPASINSYHRLNIRHIVLPRL